MSTDNSDVQSETATAQMYRHASVVELTMDDPVNGYDEGTVMIIEGECEDEVAHTVLDEEKQGFLDIECDVLETFESDTEMSKSDIKDWAVTKAKASEVEY